MERIQLTSWQLRAKAELARRQRTKDTGWPDVYVNSDTGKPYKPHKLEERQAVFSDTPRYVLLKGGEGGGKSVAGIIKDLERLRRGMNGAMCCVAPETMINGTPIAERTVPEQVNTIFGKSWATASYLKGKADLFRLVTQSGEMVTVTKNHRFLTPIGWHQMKYLHAGSVIAADENANAHSHCEKRPNSLGYCFEDFHLDDELSNLVERYSQGRLRQLALLTLGDARCDGLPFRVCIDRFLCQSIWGVGVLGFQLYLRDCKAFCALCDIFPGCHQLASRFCSLKEVVRYPYSGCADTVCEMQIAHALLQSGKFCPQRIQQDRKFLEVPFQNHTARESERDQFLVDDLLFSWFDYTSKVKWVQIKSITFQKYGEFYDLTVPGIGHYSAHGLWHHNSPDLEHFKKSLWPEFRRWCPWDRVVKKHRYRQAITWEPSRPFSLVFNNAIGTQSTLMCGGAKESEIGGWEGPNISFVHMDEFRRHKKAGALKVFDGRIRIPGPNGELPQIYITTTPRKHWLYEYFGPLKDDDPRAAFKADSLVVTLLTVDNAENLEPDFTRKRAQTLTAAEARVLLKAEWEDIDTGQRFLPNILLWDACRVGDIPPLTEYEPMVLALDAAVVNDCFAMIGVTRHPQNDEVVVVRFVQVWEPKGHPLDYLGTEAEPGPEMVLKQLAERYNVICVVYDPYQLHDFSTRLAREGIAWFKEFGQGAPRLESDQQLLSLITQRRLMHDGNAILRQHIENADRKLNDDGKLRIVKREDAAKVDAGVALGMGAHQCLFLRL